MISEHKLALLRSKEQRFRLYFATWGTWQLEQSTPLLVKYVDGEEEPKIKYLGKQSDDDFKPVINIGPNRLAFVSEPISFDASKSWERGKNPGQGIDGGVSWSFEGGSPDEANGEGPHEVSWNAPGLYTVTCHANQGGRTKRWVRVLENRLKTDWDIVGISGPNGSLDSGWQARLTLQPNDDGKEGSGELSLESFQAAGIFIEEEWVNEEGEWERTPVGNGHEPRLLMSGYIVQNSVKRDANTHVTELELSSLASQLQLGFVHSMTSWWTDYVERMRQKDPTAMTDKLQGAEFDVNKLTMVDLIQWWLREYTNVFEWHDFYGYKDDDQQELDTFTTSEGALWNALQEMASNEFAWLFCDHANALRFEPNAHLVSRDWWKDRYEIPMTFTDEDLINIDVSQLLHRNVVWVYFRAVHTMTGRQFNAYHPDRQPPDGPGQWLKIDNIKASDKNWVEKMAERVYKDGNRKIEVTLACAMNRVCTLPDRIGLTIELPDREINWTNKKFVVDSIGYAIDLASNSFRTQLHAKEEV